MHDGADDELLFVELKILHLDASGGAVELRAPSHPTRKRERTV